MTDSPYAKHQSDRTELRDKNAAPCRTCGGAILRAIENGKRFNRVPTGQVLSYCLGCQGFGSPELIPDDMIRALDWQYTSAHPADANIIRKRRAALVTRTNEEDR